MQQEYIIYSDLKYSAGIATIGAAVDQGNTSGSAEDSMQLKELMVLLYLPVGTMINSYRERVKNTKQPLVNACLKLGKNQRIRGRKTQDNLTSIPLVIESMKEKSTDFVTPTKASGEAQKEEISPTILGKEIQMGARSMAKKIDTGLDAEEEINTGREEINTELRKIKEEFDKLVQQIDTFVPINLEAIKAKFKRYGEELQTKTSEKQKIDDKDVPAIREKKYRTNRPEDTYDRVLWSDLKTMFDPPLNEDAIWSLPLQQKMCCTKALATLEQMAIGKEISNPLIADSLLKTIRLSMHLVTTKKH
ncbi:hypothetical protein Tco_0031701 [Tanacetum coccineum]